MRLLKLFLIRGMIIVFRGQMFHVTSFWKWPDRQSFLFFFAYSHISNPRDSTKPVSSTFKRYSFIAILFSCTGRIRSYFKRPVDSRNQKKKEKKCTAQENCRLLSFVRWKVKERQRWNRERRRKKNGGQETVIVSDGFSKRFAFARRKRVRPSFSFRPRGRNVQLRLIRISTSLSRSSRPPLSAGRRGGRAGRVYTLSPRFESSSHRVFTFYEKQSERIFTAIAFTIVSGSHCFLHVKSYRVNGQAF